MRITQVLVLALVGTALSTQFAVADADGERAALARYTLRNECPSGQWAKG